MLMLFNILITVSNITLFCSRILTFYLYASYKIYLQYNRTDKNVETDIMILNKVSTPFQIK